MVHSFFQEILTFSWPPTGLGTTNLLPVPVLFTCVLIQHSCLSLPVALVCEVCVHARVCVCVCICACVQACSAYMCVCMCKYSYLHVRMYLKYTVYGVAVH